ncbi:hypothetical protein PVK06_023392 [Gossypium arboreum]|uniref:Uncharacterized protein n=1 Tax=Gossypium arboreum TaxID=29729 RepID=A0ABR0PBA6_GOSAR|nr:hypothetical protein PVK06_023392 [Gossypium arboreum]
MEFQQQNPNSIRKSGNVQVESSSIQLIYLHLPSPSQLPPHHHTTRSLPPHLFPFLIPAFDAAKPNFSNILSTLKPNLVIYDFLQPWAAAAANEQDVESVMFLTTGADVGKQTVPVGPLVQECGNRKEDVHIMEWLGKKEPGSVVLVSFGSDLFISKEDMEEIAMGLELSKICFIWAVRFQGGYNMFYWKAFQRDLRRGV